MKRGIHSQWRRVEGFTMNGEGIMAKDEAEEDCEPWWDCKGLRICWWLKSRQQFWVNKIGRGSTTIFHYPKRYVFKIPATKWFCWWLISWLDVGGASRIWFSFSHFFQNCSSCYRLAVTGIYGPCLDNDRVLSSENFFGWDTSLRLHGC